MLDLLQATVADIPLKHKGPLLIVDSTDSINGCLQTFVARGLLSAPVWDEATKSFLGSMDLMDIVRVIVETFGLEEVKRHDVQKLMQKQKLFTETPIKEVYDFKVRNPFVPVTRDTSLAEVLKIMTQSDTYIRRVAVMDTTKEGKEQIVSIVSQAGLINYISKHHSFIPSHQKIKTVEDFYKPQKRVVAISGGQVVMEAFQLMKTENVSGIAVVDDEGHLIGSLSIRDLKGLVVNNGIDLARLLMPARTFVNIISQMSMEEKHPAVSVLVTDTLTSVVDKIAAAGVHRLFVVDSKLMPVGVVSLVDVLHALSTE
eukprot:comp18493_c0_seq1/m.19866 comp18493_c0_seq1/g.19866  ORF comp18493_c0_seq1/g.19866 comp18493_c0_seq1/m.19866 type:complete len:314 (-) comp18493_c0_seq1:286-1227(-)